MMKKAFLHIDKIKKGSYRCLSKSHSFRHAKSKSDNSADVGTTEATVIFRRIFEKKNLKRLNAREKFERKMKITEESFIEKNI